MTTSNSFLDVDLTDNLRDLDDALGDFRRVDFQAVPHALDGYLRIAESSALGGVLLGLPKVDIDEFLGLGALPAGAMAGSGVLRWPHLRDERVAMQLALCRAIADGKIEFFTFVHENYSVGTNLQAHVSEFGRQVLDPLTRDIRRLASQRPVDPILSSTLRRWTNVSDAVLAELIREAVSHFTDASPSSRSRALEKLWDAYERLKSLENPASKRDSTQKLLDRAAAPGTVFRQALDAEAQALTSLGNDLHIRHFEVSREQIGGAKDADYLFHRLYAFIILLLASPHP